MGQRQRSNERLTAAARGTYNPRVNMWFAVRHPRVDARVAGGASTTPRQVPGRRAFGGSSLALDAGTVWRSPGHAGSLPSSGPSPILGPMETPKYAALADHLHTLQRVLPALLQATLHEPPSGIWLQALERNVLPSLELSVPVLLVAICGGGSTGKSTLVNALAGRCLSEVAFRAGLTARVLLVGHPEVLAGQDVAERLLHRLPERPIPWSHAGQTAEPGPPLWATSRDLPRNLLLIDTPDFDTGDAGQLLNRQRAEPILRTAEVLVYVFTNAVYNNLSNTMFMADVVGGIGGRPTVLVYRVSRVASDPEVLEHCSTVAHRLYKGNDRGVLPPEVIGIYRVHESDAVAAGRSPAKLIPLGEVTAGRSLSTLLGDLDVSSIKRRVFASDLKTIRMGANHDLRRAEQAALQASLYRDGMHHALAKASLRALKAFPANEALALTAQLFVETSPPLVRALRQTGLIVGAPFRALRATTRKIADWLGPDLPPAKPADLQTLVRQDLLEAASFLRNRLFEDPLTVRLGDDHPLLGRARALESATGGSAPLAIRPVGRGTYDLHIQVPSVAHQGLEELLEEDWEEMTAGLDRAASELVSLPTGIRWDLKEAVSRFRQDMGLWQRLRETLFASLSALPPILGVTYALLTADPVSATGLQIRLQSILGLNDLWALVSIPASAGLSEQDRRQLETMLEPVFRLWLQQRAGQVSRLLEETVCRPTLEALEEVPRPEDPRFARVTDALLGLGGAR
jgi:hypothetical protein